MSLYPLKFKPIYKTRIWGGDRIKKLFNRKPVPPADCGESWEISAVSGNLSVVSDGFLAGNNIQELTEIYMGDLVGEKVFDQFGIEFPVLIKYIDANELLSIQVHPDDEMARRVHHAYGKNEMWYVIDAEPGAEIFAGFNTAVGREKYLDSLKQKQLHHLLNREPVNKGDVFYIPSGTVHAINKGVFLAEIQQTSDITYRIYDWDRTDKKGKPRELHPDLALEAISFETAYRAGITYNRILNERNEILKKPCFNVNFLKFDKSFSPDYHLLDSFVIYICVEGEMLIEYGTSRDIVKVEPGSVVLIPASLTEFTLRPSQMVTLLEVYIP